MFEACPEAADIVILCHGFGLTLREVGELTVDQVNFLVAGLTWLGRQRR